MQRVCDGSKPNSRFESTAALDEGVRLESEG